MVVNGHVNDINDFLNASSKSRSHKTMDKGHELFRSFGCSFNV